MFTIIVTIQIKVITPAKNHFNNIIFLIVFMNIDIVIATHSVDFAAIDYASFGNT